MASASNCYQSFLYVSKYLLVRKPQWQRKINSTAFTNCAMYVFVEFLGAIIHKPEYLMKGKILGTKHYPTCLIVFDPL